MQLSMIERRSVLIVAILFLLAAVVLDTPPAAAFPGDPSDWHMNGIRKKDNGFYESTTSDAYVIFTPIERCKCDIGGVRFRIEFESMPYKALLMELFWRSRLNNFNEKQKLFSILAPNPDGNIIDFTIPLTDVVPFYRQMRSVQPDLFQLRLDFPISILVNFKLHHVELLDMAEMPTDTRIVTPIYALTPSETLDPHVVVPFLTRTLRHGFWRLGQDPLFAAFWLLVIACLLAGLRQISRSLRINP